MAKKSILIRSKLRKAEVYLQENRPQEAMLLLQQLSKLDGSNPEIWSKMSVLHRKFSDYSQAEMCAKKAIRLAPSNPSGLFSLGAVLHAQGRLEEAITYYKRTLEIIPENVDANYYLANALREIGKVDAAVAAYETLLLYAPEHFEGLNNLGALLTNLERAEEAREILQRAFDIDNNSVEILTNLARANLLIGIPDVAVDYLQRAIKKQPGFYDAYLELGHAYQLCGEYEKAIHAFKKAQQLNDGSIRALIGEAMIYEKQGKYEAAYSIIGPLIESGESVSGLPEYFDISSKINQRARAVALIQKTLERHDINLAATAPLHFRLGKHYDQEGMYVEAMKHYHRANLLKRRIFDIETTEKGFMTTIDVYNQRFMEVMTTSSNASDSMIFIVGMPRSGTSLVEQIMASHPDICGAGETENVRMISDYLSSQYSGEKYPEYIPKLTVDILNRASKKLLNKYKGRFPEAHKITDKMPQNFIYIGLILQLLPDCHIVHCERNPLDNCLSCYFSEFGASYHNYTYDLNMLGRYYSLYAKLMDHWNNVFPGRIHKVRYEDLVMDQEAISKDIFAYCEIEWSELCLEFYKNKRVVNTISYDQVRQPIYQSSVSRWRNYEKYLAPLRDTLDEYGVHY